MYEQTVMPSAAERIAAMREDDPSCTADQIAKKIGLTRQRVAQIIKEMGLPPRVSRAKAVSMLSLAGKQSKSLAADLAVVQDLIERGFSVYRPVTSGLNEADIIAGDSDFCKLITLEVKLDKSLAKSADVNPSQIFDCIALVRASFNYASNKTSYSVCYYPALETFQKP